MNAGILRRAANLMRERAAMAPDGPRGYRAKRVVGGSYSEVTNSIGFAITDRLDNLPWHPVVALAVAAWLDLAHDQGEDDDHEVYIDGECCDECAACARFNAALVVARAFLGGAA